MPDSDTTARFPDDQYAAIIRDMLRNEDSVRTQRLTWCVQIEGLLMASLAFVWQKTPFTLSYAICAVGLFVAISALYAARITIDTMHRLTENWKGRCDPNYDGPPVIAREIRNWKWYLRPSYAIPGVFLLIWLFLLGWFLLR